MKKDWVKRFFLLAMLASVAAFAGCDLQGDTEEDDDDSSSIPSAYQALYGSWTTTMMGTEVTYTFSAEGYTASSYTYVISSDIVVGTDTDGATTITFTVTNASTNSTGERVITMVDDDTFTMPISMGGTATTYTYTRVTE